MINQFLKLGGVTNVNDFYKKFPTEAHFDNHIIKMRYGGINAYAEGGQPNIDISIVDYLASQNKAFDKTSRKKLAEKAGITDYTGRADQNENLLSMIKKDPKLLNESTNTLKTNQPIKKSKMPVNNTNKQVGPSFGFENQSWFQNAQNQYSPSNLSNITSSTKNKTITGTKSDARNLESGMIEDKNKNVMHVVKNGKVVKSFPIMTGLSRNGESNSKSLAWMDAHPKEAAKMRATPTGTYISTPNPNIYGKPGFNMKAIPAFGQPAPDAVDLAQHTMYGTAPKGQHGYDPVEGARRMKIMQGPGERRNASYGCTNMNGQDIDCLTGQLFPQGDTTIVVDSRKAADQAFLKNKYGIKRMGGAYDNVPQHGNPGVYSDGYSGTSSAGQYFDDGGAFIPDYSNIMPGQLPQFEYGKAMYGMGMAYGGVYQEGGMPPDQQAMMAQQQGQQAPQQGQPDPQQLMQQIAQMLQQGAQPEQVMQQLVQMGVPQEQAQQMIQQVMQQMQGGQEQNPQEEMAEQGPPMGRFGRQLKMGGSYEVGSEHDMSNEQIKDLIKKGYKIQYA